MATSRFTKRLWAVAAAAVGLSGAAFAQAPKAETILARQPAIAGVAVSTPTAAELAGCKVEVRQWEAGKDGVKPKGVVVTDAAGRKLRQFIDTTGGDKWNILSYYLDGDEAFREVDTNGNGKPDTFRWLGANGGKQGVDSKETGTIDQWTSITAEEVSQEVFAAVVNRDTARLKAVLATESEIKALKLPSVHEQRLLKKLEGAAAKLAKANGDLKLSAKAKWIHVELDPPHTTPRDVLGTAEDLVRHRSVGVLVDATGDGKEMKYLSAGEMVQIGKTWRLVDGPSAGLTSATDEPVDGVGPPVPEPIKEHVAKIAQILPPKDAADMARYQLERAVLLEKCVAGTSGAEQLPWLKQMIDAYAAAVESGPDNANAYKRFGDWNATIQKGGAEETKAYSAFRFSGAEYAVKLKEAGSSPAKMQEVQVWRKESLEKFVKAFATSADAPEAIMQLAIAAEFDPKDGEKVAKAWYERLIKDYAGYPHATKAAGAIKRLGCEGQPFELSGETLDGKAFTAKDLGGKPAVVLWWASWGSNMGDELKNLAALEKAYAAKGLTVVTVILDEEGTKQAAADLLKASGVGGYHLYAAGGLDRSPLAAAYGIHGIPHVFLVKDGKVADRSAQYGAGLKEDVEKMMK